MVFGRRGKPGQDRDYLGIEVGVVGRRIRKVHSLSLGSLAFWTGLFPLSKLFWSNVLQIGEGEGKQR